MAELLFFIAGIGAIAGAIGTIVLRTAFYSVLALVGHLLSLAALFLLLRAEFLAAAQVVVYAGAVMVLYVFVVAYIGRTEEAAARAPRAVRVIAPVVGVALLVELCIAVLGSGLSALGTEGPNVDATGVPGAEFGSPKAIGELLLTKFLLAFEVASFLLLIAAVGAVILARRRTGLEEVPGELSVSDLLSSSQEKGTLTAAGRGTQLEAGGPAQH